MDATQATVSTPGFGYPTLAFRREMDGRYRIIYGESCVLFAPNTAWPGVQVDDVQVEWLGGLLHVSICTD